MKIGIDKEILKKQIKNYLKIINKSIPTTATNKFETQTIDFEEMAKLDNKYREIINLHFKLLEKIGYQYSVAVNQENILNIEATKCIELCKKDIALAPMFKEYWVKDCILRNQEPTLPDYVSYKRLSMIYEKQRDYFLAIMTCVDAVKLGYLRDGTNSGMQGRLARLIKKNNEINSIKLQFDYDKNILYNKDTGEIIE